jgi:hypothetical protein
MPLIIDALHDKNIACRNRTNKHHHDCHANDAHCDLAQLARILSIPFTTVETIYCRMIITLLHTPSLYQPIRSGSLGHFYIKQTT